MKSASLLRKHIETTLAERMPAALSPRIRVELERASCGIEALDDLLSGGLPVGVLSELVGPESSGRTTVALSLLASITSAEQVAAWIDVDDTLDPESAAANGVDLERLLWVRCGLNNSSDLIKPTTQSIKLPLLPGASSVTARGGGSPHPRSEGQGMPQAITAMLLSHGGLYDKHVRREKKSIGTPGAPNRPLTFRAEDREEQVASDRLPARRGKLNISPRCAEPSCESPRAVSQSRWNPETQHEQSSRRMPAKSTCSALDQALRSTDLLLQAGGFSVIVLDLGGIPAEIAWRIPLATWFRLRAACERTQVSLLLLTQHSCARSAAELVVRMAPGQMQAQSKVMSAIAYSAETERHRFQPDSVVSIRKRPQSERPRSASWNGTAAWARER